VRYIYAVVAGGRRQPCPAVPLADANGQRDDSTVEHLHVHGDEHLQYRDKQVFEGGRQRIAKRLVNRIELPPRTCWGGARPWSRTAGAGPAASPGPPAPAPPTSRARDPRPRPPPRHRPGQGPRSRTRTTSTSASTAKVEKQGTTRMQVPRSSGWFGYNHQGQDRRGCQVRLIGNMKLPISKEGGTTRLKKDDDDEVPCICCLSVDLIRRPLCSSRRWCTRDHFS
jgi:hypothetical protein